MKTVLNKIIEETNIKAHNLKDIVIKALEMNLTEGRAFWQLEHTINELISDIEYDLIENGTISEDDNLQDIIDNSNEDIRNKIFNILVTPVEKYFDNKGYVTSIDTHFEGLTIFNK